MSTPTDRAAWQALADGATPGPWEVGTEGWVETVGGDGEDWSYVRRAGTTQEVTNQMLHNIEGSDEQTERDHEFIAAAREAVPTLLAEVADLEARLVVTGQAVSDELEEAMAWQARCLTAEAEVQRLRAGIEALLRIAEYRDSMSLSCDFEGRPFKSPIPQDDLRALLDGAQ